MASLLHHHGFHFGSGIDTETGIYWAAGIGFTLLMAGLFCVALTSSAGLDASISLPLMP